jgi:uncharacterized protein (DUF885 family)
MRRSPRRGLALLLPVLTLLAMHACARPLGEPAPPLGDLVARYEREITPYYPISASEAGLRQYDRVLANDIGQAHRRSLHALCARYLAEVRRIDPATLAGGARLDRDLFERELSTCVDSFRFPWHLLPINQVGHTWPSRFPVMGSGRGTHPFRTVQNYRDFLGRIDGFVTWMDTAIANMRVGAERGITHPRDAMARVLPQLDAHIVSDPTTSVFYEPIRNLPADFDEASRRALTASYVNAIEHAIVPAYRRLRTFLATEYLPRCRTSVGFGALPDGRAWYAQAVRRSTTTTLSPARIHALGLAEVARISRARDGLMREIAAAGEPEPTRYRSVEELVRAYTELRASVETVMPRLFGRLPRAAFEVRAIEPFRERSMPSSYVASSIDGLRPGVFYLNTGDARGQAGAIVLRNLFLHEAVPGHHLQMALQRENTELPRYRRFGWFTAFGEGWALYAESLGPELGVYPTRHDRLAMLEGELFRARRLVVDVGLHELGWTREQALPYRGGPTPNNELEVERYMVWPGQALAYKIGQLKIRELRTRAEAALGPVFDVRAFHDELLRDGAMPLDILETKMDRWLQARRRR